VNYSRQRQIILESLRENAVHPGAEYLYDIVKKEEPNLSLATLYRNLNRLAGAGIIKKIEGLEESAHYDHNTHEHYHFLCTKCNKIFDVSSDVAPDLLQKTESQTGFKVESYDIIFKGICNECR
jgi:Fur family peroxide stress response transcriptional regulator